MAESGPREAVLAGHELRARGMWPPDRGSHPEGVAQRSSIDVHTDNGQHAPDEVELPRWLDERLERWLMGLPWVVERPPFQDRPALRCFAIDCAPLGLRRVWALVGPFTKETDPASSAHVVLPNWLADHTQSSGDGTIALSLGDRHALVSLDSQRKPIGVERLHSLLLLAYAAAFS
jgi:hypothetical protein